MRAQRSLGVALRRAPCHVVLAVTAATAQDVRESQAGGRSRRARWIGWVLVVGCIVLPGLWGFWLEPRRLVVNEQTLDVPHWPEALRGTRVVLLSDLHVGSPYWHLPELEGLVERANGEAPDLVLLAGDYVIDSVLFGTKIDPESIARVLGGLRAPLGVVAVLGNHDWWNGGQRIRRALESEGIVVLENDAHRLEKNQTRFFVVGLADALTRRIRLDAALAGIGPDDPFLLLAHEPDVFAGLPDRASLMLAGHTHGGQVRLPFLGRLIVPSRYGQRYAAGHILENGRHLFVTTGVGTSTLPVRFGVAPELAVLILE